MATRSPLAPHRPSWRSAPLFVIVALALMLSGCSLRQDDRPREIPRASLPDVLFQQSPANATAGSESRTLYLVKTAGATESLVKVLVPIQPPANPGDFPRAIIDKLVTNPPTSDSGEFASVVPLGTRVLGVTQHDDVLDINLSNALGTVENKRQRLAVGQIVFTATAIVGINFVRFFIEGTPSAVPVDDHTSEVGALISREDFPRLRPGALSTTTVAPVPPTPDPAAPVGGTTSTDPVTTDSVQSK